MLCIAVTLPSNFLHVVTSSRTSLVTHWCYVMTLRYSVMLQCYVMEHYMSVPILRLRLSNPLSSISLYLFQQAVYHPCLFTRAMMSPNLTSIIWSSSIWALPRFFLLTLSYTHKVYVPTFLFCTVFPTCR